MAPPAIESHSVFLPTTMSETGAKAEGKHQQPQASLPNDIEKEEEQNDELVLLREERQRLKEEMKEMQTILAKSKQEKLSVASKHAKTLKEMEHLKKDYKKLQRDHTEIQESFVQERQRFQAQIQTLQEEKNHQVIEKETSATPNNNGNNSNSDPHDLIDTLHKENEVLQQEVKKILLRNRNQANLLQRLERKLQEVTTQSQETIRDLQASLKQTQDKVSRLSMATTTSVTAPNNNNLQSQINSLNRSSSVRLRPSTASSLSSQASDQNTMASPPVVRRSSDFPPKSPTFQPKRLSNTNNTPVDQNQTDQMENRESIPLSVEATTSTMQQQEPPPPPLNLEPSSPTATNEYAQAEKRYQRGQLLEATAKSVGETQSAFLEAALKKSESKRGFWGKMFTGNKNQNHGGPPPEGSSHGGQSSSHGGVHDHASLGSSNDNDVEHRVADHNNHDDDDVVVSNTEFLSYQVRASIEETERLQAEHDNRISLENSKHQIYDKNVVDLETTQSHIKTWKSAVKLGISLLRGNESQTIETNHDDQHHQQQNDYNFEQGHPLRSPSKGSPGRKKPSVISLSHRSQHESDHNDDNDDDDDVELDMETLRLMAAARTAGLTEEMLDRQLNKSRSTDSEDDDDDDEGDDDDDDEEDEEDESEWDENSQDGSGHDDDDDDSANDHDDLPTNPGQEVENQTSGDGDNNTTLHSQTSSSYGSYSSDES